MSDWIAKGAVAVTAGLLLLVAAAAFFLFPRLDTQFSAMSMWEAICASAGVPTPRKATEPPVQKASGVTPTRIAVDFTQSDAIGRGATLAHQCAICHGPAGISRADSPTLGGEYPSSIYKQLRDFRSGARVSAIMTPFAVNLSDRDVEDLSAYYAFLPRVREGHEVIQPLPAPAIVTGGAPMRGIAPCESCHGGIALKTGSPRLSGQPQAYLQSQLEAFASGRRSNDIGRQMRNIARAMTPEEIQQAAIYYASR